MIKAIIGIGNYGNKFINTRHNAGICFIKKLIYQFKKKLFYNKKVFGYYSYININNSKILIYIPYSLMNDSGKYIKILINYYKFLIKDIIIIHDDMSFPPGISKLKFGGGSSGHNGIKSIINYNNSKEFYRIRIGIGKPKKNININDFVLSDPTIYEKKMIYKSINKSIISIEKFVNFGSLIAMNYLNTDSF